MVEPNAKGSTCYIITLFLLCPVANGFEINQSGPCPQLSNGGPAAPSLRKVGGDSGSRAGRLPFLFAEFWLQNEEFQNKVVKMQWSVGGVWVQGA